MIIHILSDGREVESIEGYVIPTTGPTEAVYKILADHARKRPGSTQENNEDIADATA